MQNPLIDSPELQVDPQDSQRASCLPQHRVQCRTQRAAGVYLSTQLSAPAFSGAFVEGLEKALAQDKKLAKRQRRTGIVLFEQLQAEGYAGS